MAGATSVWWRRRWPIRAPERWQELIAHRDDVMLEDIDVFAGHYVVHERADGLIRLRVTELTTGDSHHVEFPEPTYELSGDVNAEFALPAYRFRYQSFITPASVYDYDVAGRKLMLLKQTPVLGDYDPTRYRSERIHAIAARRRPRAHLARLAGGRRRATARARSS